LKRKLLIKFPTRNRPQKFLEVLTKYVQMATDKANIQFIVSYDMDDYTMSPDVIKKAESLKNVKCIEGVSLSKIDACNRDIEEAGNWDIIVLASDDMIPVTIGWDQIIRNSMDQSYPDLDGVLYFPDGYTTLNTMCIMGKKYFDRFNYIYHPDYMSLWCDNEFMEVANSLGKQKKFNQTLFKHEHPANNKTRMDSLYLMNEKFYSADRITYMNRKKMNFGL
jgi:hypothetical protein